MQSRSNKEIRNRTLGIVIAATVLIAVVIAYGLTALDQVRSIDTHWTQFSTINIKREKQIHRIQRELGYGGFIHNFKNFILRSDPRYLDLAYENLDQIRDAIDLLRREKLSAAEATALDDMATTVKAYAVRLVMADDGFAEGMSSNQVDSLVIVDDSRALAALEALADASALRLHQVQEATQKQLNATIRFAALGLLAVPLILLIGYILYRSLRSMVRAHDVARKATRRLEGLLDTSPEAMIVADINGVIVRANQVAAKMLDYKPGGLIGLSLAALVTEEKREQHRAQYQKFVKSPKFGICEIAGDIQALTKTGRKVPVEISLSALEQDSELLVTAAVRDITLRLAYEDALVEAREKAIAANDAKSEFLANMSHEIRTPINAVIGLSCLALKTKLNVKQLDYTNKIYKAGRRLLEVINDVLDFSKIEAGRLDLDHSKFQLNTVIRDVSDLVAVQAEEKGIDLIFRISPDVPNAMIGDPFRLGQILSNLVNNAIKFTEAGSVVIAGDVFVDDDNARMLRFSVTDTGIGIPTDRMSGLFDAFTQADTSTTRRFGGTGLGLAICKNIVEIMGGQIGVESEAENGSVFTFKIPIEKDPNAEFSQNPTKQIKPESVRVLVVDDSEITCRVLKEELGALGFPVDTVLNGHDAIRVLKKAGAAGNPYNLLLLDWQMPGMDGVETALCIEMDTDIAAIPTLFLVTVFGKDDARELAKDLPIDAFLNKPLNTSVVIDTLVTVLTRSGDGGPLGASIDPGVVTLVEAAKGKRVLVVEDNNINQQVAREILESEGLLVDTADNGRIAVDLLFKKGPDAYAAILMDIQMPEMDGVMATREIRTDPSFNDVPILALTAHALNEDRQRSLDAGMNGHLTKPVIADDLIAALNTWIAGVEPRKEPDVASSVRENDADSSTVDVGMGEDILALPIINLEKASSISHLSKDFLEELLCDFKDRYEDASQTIRTHLDAGERSEAQIIAHTVKGISGSLGAEQVYAAAVALDAGLKEEVPDEIIDKLSDDFSTALEALLMYISDNIVRPEAK